MPTEYTLTERLVGRGPIFDGETRYGPVDYIVEIYDGWLTDGRGGRVKGVGRIDGQLLNLDHQTMAALFGKDSLMLQLEDGRRWHCWMQNSDGRLMNRGGFTSPS